jgi:ribosomal protein L34E
MFRIYCDNKGCGKDMEPLLNVNTGDVECTECGRAIKSITSFTKSQMKAIGQVKRDEKVKQAFSVQCRSCMKESAPKLGSKKEIRCSICDSHLDYLSAPYTHAVREFLLTRQKNPATVSVSPVNVVPKVNSSIK